jgi:hypothetical protein
MSLDLIDHNKPSLEIREFLSLTNYTQLALQSSPNELNRITLLLVSNSSKVQCSNRERISLLTC